jgi:hypothetical protein
MTRGIHNRIMCIVGLCIDVIQDDDRDWRHESALMAQVYGNSILTISASGAFDGSVGPFFQRLSSLRCQFKIERQNKKQKLYECIPRHFQDRLEDMPLLNRG